MFSMQVYKKKYKKQNEVSTRMGTGQAAGAAAAHSIREGKAVQDIDTDALIATLRGWGAVI